MKKLLEILYLFFQLDFYVCLCMLVYLNYIIVTYQGKAAKNICW